MNPPDNTIAAIATPIGIGSISVIRISGKDAIAVADRRFCGRRPLASAESHTAHVGTVIDENGGVVDEVVATVFKAPHSYTAEDVVELSCHGGFIVTRRVLEAYLRSGARPAEPGEFTRRAFLNGRIDLSQAEAVADIIQATSEAAHKASMHQLNGRLSQHIGNIRDKLVKVCSLLELELDFVEEGLEFTEASKVEEEIQGSIDLLDDLIRSYEVGKLYREGVSTVIAGKPNVGKSSILNTLLNEARAIVTPIPGTTRDTIEENLMIDGILFKLIDTAGLRQSEDIVEIEGMKRTRVEMESSDIILYVVDAEHGADGIDLKMIDEIRESRTECLLLINKSDLRSGEINLPDADGLPISALTGSGFPELRKKMVERALHGKSFISEGSVIVTNARHRDSLVRGRKNLASALDGVRQRASNEFIALDIREAMDSLGEIIGLVTTEDILNSIFSKFCIGK